jgi:type IV pilus assembly protein PilW
MVALAVGAILLAGIGGLIRATHDSNRLQESQSRVQERAYFALSRMERDLLAAGYLGCASAARLTQLDVVSSGSPFLTNDTNALGGFDASGSGAGDTLNMDNAAANWTPALPPQGQGRAIPGTDVLVVRRGVGPLLPLSRAKANDRLFVEPAGGLDGNCTGNLCVGDRAVVTDCSRARVFTVTGVQGLGSGEHVLFHAASDNDVAQWGGPAADDARFHFTTPGGTVQRVATVAWFLEQVNGVPTLSRWADGNVTRIARGVETMQLFFGEDTDDDGTLDRYSTAGQVNDFPAVHTVHIALLLTGDQPLRRPGRAPNFQLGPGANGGVTITGNADRLLHRAASLTIRLRNRREAP